MKTLIFLLALLTFGSSGIQADSQINNQASSVLKASPRYIFTDKLASLDSITITPGEVEIGQSIQFGLKLIGLENLSVAMFYVTADAKEYFLTELENLGNGSHSGAYQIPEVEFGTYTQFRAIASSGEKQQTLISGVFPGITVVPTPDFKAQLTPTTVSIGDSILFSAEVTGFEVSSVEIHYDIDGQRFPITSLFLQSSESSKEIYEGVFIIPGGIPAGDYNGFIALAKETGSDNIFQTELTETVTLDTHCATANITVNDDSGERIAGANVTIANQSVLTNAQGQATLNSLEDNTEQTVTVSANDFMPNEAKISLSCLAIAGATVILTPTTQDCAQLDVNVVDNSSGEAEPIAGATVTVASKSAITDAMGNASLTAVLEGMNTLSTAHVDYAEDQREVTLSCTEPTQETVILEPIIKNCAILDVLVTDASQQPIIGAQVVIANQSGSTDSAGRVTLTEIREDATQLDVSASGFGPVQNSISMNCIEPVSINVVMDGCANVVFAVFSLDGNERFPVLGAQVDVTDSSGNIFQQTTGESGQVTFAEFNPGPHNYTVTNPNFSTVSNAFAITECRSNSEEIIFIEVPMTFISSIN